MNKLPENLQLKYNELVLKNYSLNMARGKPCEDQLNLSNDLLSMKLYYESCDGVDIRNYGQLTGLRETKKLIGELVDISEDNVFIYGTSSLNIMYDFISRSMTHGVNGSTPWCKLDKVKWICPTPGYDRHFAICEFFGIEMINVPLNDDGPDMEIVESLIKDPSVKGIWCVPQYSNPTGITYSDEIVSRIAKLKPAAKDFRVYWDNAYCVHHLYKDDQEHVLNIIDECKKTGNEDLVYEFVSFSKISFSGSGVAAVISSDRNLDFVKKQLTIQTIGFDKVNQLRHVLFFKNKENIMRHMMKHAEIIRPKMDLIDEVLSKEVKDFARWNKPKGGYFVSLYVDGKAREVINRCKEMGLTLTDAGCSYPYHKDPSNSHIRLAPTYLSLDELKIALDILSLAIKIECN